MSSQPSGCAGRLPQLIIVFIVAALLAAGLFVAIPYLQGRPQYARGTYDLMVEGNRVHVVMDPALEVFLVPVGGAASGTGGQTIGQVATATPAVLPTLGPLPTVSTLPTAPPPLPATVTPIPRAACVAFTNYTVQAGDTLYSISRKFVTSIPLMARHGISSTNLVPGNVLRVPVGDPACCSGGWKPYVVEDGDSWFGIAQSSGISTDTLLQTNGLPAGSPLYMTSVICVP